MADIQYDPACADCRRDAAKDVAGTTWQCTGHVRAERDWLRARMALVVVEAEHEKEVLTRERNAALTLAEQRGAAYDIAWREAERLRERLDQFEAYAITVDSALRDRERALCLEHIGTGAARSALPEPGSAYNLPRLAEARRNVAEGRKP
mgnify:CR=1 FL=1